MKCLPEIVSATVVGGVLTGALIAQPTPGGNKDKCVEDREPVPTVCDLATLQSDPMCNDVNEYLSNPPCPQVNIVPTGWSEGVPNAEPAACQYRYKYWDDAEENCEWTVPHFVYKTCKQAGGSPGCDSSES